MFEGALVFNAFRDDFQAQVVCKADGGTDDDGVLFVQQHVLHEGAVDFEGVDG